MDDILVIHFLQHRYFLAGELFLHFRQFSGENLDRDDTFRILILRFVDCCEVPLTDFLDDFILIDTHYLL